MRKIVQGSGGSQSGSTHTPTQANDTLSSTAYAQILDLVSEGPIFGLVDPDGAKSVYLDNTPLKNADGSLNFNVNQLDSRTGTIDQTYIPHFDSTANTTSVGVELKQILPWVQTFTDLTLNAVSVTLGVNGLSQTDQVTGDVTGYTVAYQIQLSVDGGAFAIVVNTAFNGKASSTYNRTHRINLTGATSEYTIRVIRTTPDSTSQFIVDTTTVVSYSSIIDGKLRYPMSALVAVSLDAAQFSSVPTRSYDMKGLLIKYPSNYDPNTRVYSGTWDGSFVTGWTDNPAWVFYDLVLNTRYGLGKRVDATMVDRFALYQIAKYCDVMVSDGKGGVEPRFTCNCYIQSRTDAYKVLQDLASVFRGMAYWSVGSVIATADIPTDPVYVYTAANVIQGQFKYVGSSLKTRYTVALVTWNDPENAYKSAVEYVEDADGVVRYGINKSQITAFACTSRAQAQRVGQWSILTSRLETNVVTFGVGLDGTLAQPGQIIAVADPARAGRRLGGRVHSVVSTNQVTVDKLMSQAATGDKFTVVSPSGVSESSTISAISGNTVTVNPPLAVQPAVGSAYMIESTTVLSQLFRVLTVHDVGGLTFEITATQYEQSKYAAIDSGAAIDVRPITGIPLNTQAAPTGVALSQYVVVDQGIAKTNMTIAWVAAPGAVAYTVQWRKDSGDWVDAGRTGGTSLDVHNIYSGKYIARVRAINSLDVSSVYATSSETTLAGKTGAPPVVTTLTASTDQVFAVRLNWTFPITAGDTAYTEVYYSHTNDFSTATQQGRYSYPTNTASLLGLSSGFDLYFWVRIVDTTGNVGAFFPAQTGSGVHGQATADATAILGYLTGQITATQLSTDLRTAIAVISPEMAGSASAFAGDNVLYAGVWSEQSARIDGDVATATKLDQVQAVAGSSSAIAAASFSATASLSGQLAASYTIKTQITADGRTYIAGIGVGIDNSSGQVESQVLVTADRFAIIQQVGGAAFAPFVIQGGQCFINQAFIGDAYITTAKIADAAITTAKIQDASISNAKIGAAQILSANIADAQITAAKIVDANITSAKIGTAQIVTAHIGTAQIDTLRIGANAVTTLAAASGGGSPSLSYTSSGGQCFVIGNVSGGGGASILLDGVTLGASMSSGPFGTPTNTTVTFVGVIAAGTHTLTVTGGNSDKVATISVFEAKR